MDVLPRPPPLKREASREEDESSQLVLARAPGALSHCRVALRCCDEETNFFTVRCFFSRLSAWRSPR